MEEKKYTTPPPVLDNKLEIIMELISPLNQPGKVTGHKYKIKFNGNTKYVLCDLTSITEQKIIQNFKACVGVVKNADFAKHFSS